MKWARAAPGSRAAVRKQEPREQEQEPAAWDLARQRARPPVQARLRALQVPCFGDVVAHRAWRACPRLKRPRVPLGGEERAWAKRETTVK